MSLQLKREFSDGAWRYVAEQEDGGSPTTLSEDVTTDADEFFVVHTFDLGGITSFYAKATILALTPDGETFGDQNGEIQADTIWAVSRDGVYWAGPGAPAPLPGTDAGSWTPAGYLHNLPSDAVDEVIDIAGMTPRYLRLATFIYDVTSGEIYAGANNPTATVRLDVEYL